MKKESSKMKNHPIVMLSLILSVTICIITLDPLRVEAGFVSKDRDYMEEALSKKSPELIESDYVKFNPKKSNVGMVPTDIPAEIFKSIDESIENVTSEFSDSAVALWKTLGGGYVAAKEKILDAVDVYKKTGSAEEVGKNLTDQYGKEIMKSGIEDLVLDFADELSPDFSSQVKSYKLAQNYTVNWQETVKERAGSVSPEEAQKVTSYYRELKNGSAGTGTANNSDAGTSGSKNSKAQSLSYADMLAIRANATDDAPRKRKKEVEEKWLDVSNWIGMTADDVREVFPDIDDVEGFQVYYDGNKRIDQIEIINPELNACGIFPGSSWLSTVEQLEANGWMHDGYGDGLIPLTHIEWATDKGYSTGVDESGCECVGAEASTYLKGGLGIDILSAYPAGQSSETGGKSDRDHLFLVSVFKR